MPSDCSAKARWDLWRRRVVDRMRLPGCHSATLDVPSIYPVLVAASSLHPLSVDLPPQLWYSDISSSSVFYFFKIKFIYSWKACPGISMDVTCRSRFFLFHCVAPRLQPQDTRLGTKHLMNHLAGLRVIFLKLRSDYITPDFKNTLQLCSLFLSRPYVFLQLSSDISAWKIIFKVLAQVLSDIIFNLPQPRILRTMITLI